MVLEAFVVFPASSATPASGWIIGQVIGHALSVEITNSHEILIAGNVVQRSQQIRRVQAHMAHTSHGAAVTFWGA